MVELEGGRIARAVKETKGECIPLVRTVVNRVKGGPVLHVLRVYQADAMDFSIMPAEAELEGPVGES